MCRSHALLIGLSRGSKRCHVFAEDMRRSVFTPERGELKREGEEYGLRDVGSLTSYTHEARQAIGNGSRRHMPWVRLWAASTDEWRGALHVSPEAARVLTPTDLQPAPTFASATLWETLRASDAYVDCGALLQELAFGPGVARELLRHAWDAFAGTPWLEPRPAPIALPRKNLAPSYAEVFRSDEYLREKKNV